MSYLRPYRALFATLSMLVSASAAAQSSQPTPKAGSEDIILGAWSDPARCNAKNAKPFTFDEVVRSGPALNGRCVAVEGFWARRALFGRAAHADRRKSNVLPALEHKRIGIYAREEILEHAPQRATRYTIVGIVGQCETEWPDATMVMGYCHYTGGPIIKVAKAIAAPVRNVR
jgi:hypothetical protein